jgi:hypothetical protein
MNVVVEEQMSVDVVEPDDSMDIQVDDSMDVEC